MAKLGVFKLLAIAGELTELLMNLHKYRADLEDWDKKIADAQLKGEVVLIPLKPAQQEGARKFIKQAVKLVDKIGSKLG